ncbi:MAG: FG-GAP-like repeat-containing protein [Candidatus Krumholzibacteriia bacterium]
MRNIRIFGVFAFILALAGAGVGPAAAAVLHVAPGGDDTGDGSEAAPYATIAHALALAADGDIVSLADGTYTGSGNRDIDFLGKAVTVESASGDPAACVIDCQGSAAEPHRAFVFKAEEDSTSVLRGVTVRGGWTDGDGGAIAIPAANTSPLITNCRFEANHAAGIGGAIAAGRSENLVPGISPVIRSCVFTGNSAGRGGAVAIDHNSFAIIEDCQFTGNSASYGGALVYAWESFGVLRRCRFEGNTATADGGAVHAQFEQFTAVTDCEFIGNSARSGGAWFNPLGFSKKQKGGNEAKRYAEVFARCRFEANTAAEYGGAVYFWYGCWQEFHECEFIGNSAGVGGGAVADIYNNHNLFVDCLFAGNSAPVGGAVYVFSVPGAAHPTGTRFISCTVVANTATTGAGLYFEGLPDNFSYMVANCLVTGNGPGEGVTIAGSGLPAVTCTDIWDNEGGDWTGALAARLGADGNISIAPLYCDADAGDFHLAGNSPCAPANAGSCGRIGAFGVGCPAGQEFQVIVPGSGLDVTGYAWADYDGDGALDVYYADETPHLLRNLGGGAFLEVTAEVFPAGTTAGGAAAWGDLDNDGDPDLVRLSGAGEGDLDEVWENLGDGTLVRRLATSWCPGKGRSVVLVDKNDDGLLDIFVVKEAEGDTGLRLMHNQGGWRFRDATQPGFETNPGPSGDTAWGDWDGDGDPDLVLANFGMPDRLYWRNVVVAYIPQDLPSLGADQTHAAAWVDADGEGRLDLFRAAGPDGARLHLGDGAGGFVEATPEAWGPDTCTAGAWGDADNDGDLDVVLCGPERAVALFLNDGYGGFVAHADPVLDAVTGVTMAAWVDADGDGRLDLCLAGPGGLRVFANRLVTGNAWLEVTPLHPSGAFTEVGARIEVTSGGRVQVREFGLGAGGRAQVAGPAHFGCGPAAQVDQVRVTWPDGTVDVRTGAPTGQDLLVTWGEATPATVADGAPFEALVTWPNPFNPRTELSFTLERTATVRIVVHDVAGRVVRRLIDGETLAAGSHTVAWQGTDDTGRAVPSGMYFCRLEAGGRSEVRKLMLLR